MRLVLASRNENKLRELRAALPEWEIALLDAPGDPVEDGATFLDFVSDDPNRPVNVALTHSGDVVTISSPGETVDISALVFGYVFDSEEKAAAT